MICKNTFKIYDSKSMHIIQNYKIHLMIRKCALKILRNHHGNWIVGFICKIGTSSSFMVELWGLREGLKLVKERGFHNVEVEMDANAVVKAINNYARADQEASFLLSDCVNLLDDITFLGVTHTLREGNKCANFLANHGHSTTWGTTVLDN